MKFVYKFLFIVVMFAPNIVWADFTYQAKPISPECMADLTNNDHDKNATISLSKCSNLKKAKKVRYSDGVFTTRGVDEDDDAPYSNYAVIGQYGNKYLIDFGQWTGGSGFFTSIMWIEHQGDKLQLKSIYAGGDRCNGGTEKTGRWEYGVNLTSKDLIDLAGDGSIKMAAYRDLDTSAAGCVAEAHFGFNPDTEKSQFIYVVLDKDMDTSIEWARDFKYQVCLNEILQQYIKTGKSKLDLNGVKKLAQEFKGKCIK